VLLRVRGGIARSDAAVRCRTVCTATDRLRGRVALLARADAQWWAPAGVRRCSSARVPGAARSCGCPAAVARVRTVNLTRRFSASSPH